VPGRPRRVADHRVVEQRVSGHRVVILGGGFGGLESARRLAKLPVSITLVDRRNHHLFQPLLYQVATAGLSPGDIAEPIRSILRKQRNVRVRLGEATSISLADRTVTLRDGGRRDGPQKDETLSYDTLIIATGVGATYFGNDWAHLAPGLKSLEDAVTIRRRFLSAFEQAEREPDAAARRRLLTCVIVGGGPTGVELAGTMAEMSFRSLPGDFRTVTADDPRVILVEGGPRVLAAFGEESSAAARRALERRGVEVQTGQRITAIEPGLVRLGGAESHCEIPCGNVFWAAGVGAEPLTRTLGVELDRAGRVRAAPDCTVPGHPEVFAIGDCVSLTDPNGVTVPGVAQGAIQMAVYVSRVIAARLKGKAPPRPFAYFDQGQMATIGRSAAVVELGRLRLSGLLAWVIWLFIHLIVLVGFDNRVLVLTQWAWEYLTFRRGARLITAAYHGRADSPHL